MASIGGSSGSTWPATPTRPAMPTTRRARFGSIATTSMRSLNANKPFDQFTIEQIAGDLLPNPTEEQLIATAFHRNTLTNNEGGTDNEEFRSVAVVDRVNTTMAVWMGTTMACAQCHNHKYDPLTQEEFFRLYRLLQPERRRRPHGRDPAALDIFRRTIEAACRLARRDRRLGGDAQNQDGRNRAGQRRWAAAFPLDVAWQPLVPTAVKSKAGKATDIAPDGVVTVADGAATDTHTIELASPTGPITTLRLEALPDDALPGKGPGYADGHFVMSRVSARLVPVDQPVPVGRYVRIELPGKGRILSLAEVQVFRGGENVARTGAATQSSTDFWRKRGTGDRRQHQRRLPRYPFDDAHRDHRRSVVGSRSEGGCATRSDRRLESDR